MAGFQRILFPVDFSPRAEATVPFVKEMASRGGSSITLLHALPLPVPWYPPEGGAPVLAYDVNALLDLGRERLTGFRKRHFDDLPPGVTVAEFHDQGDAATAILDYARGHETDLIMMPTHGYGQFRRLLLGSVTAKVLHDAACAVWTGAHTDDPQQHHLPVREILCAIDLGAATPAVIAKAQETALEHTARLRLVHCVPGVESGPGRFHHYESEFQRHLIADARRSIAELQETIHTALEVHLEAGEVCKVVRTAALEHDADLIVIGRGVLKETFGRLRTNAYAIIRSAPCPVLSF